MQQYAFHNVMLSWTGKTGPVMTLRDFEDTVERDQMEIPANAVDPIALASGPKRYRLKVTVLQSELEALQRSLPAGKDVTDIKNWTVTIGYLPDGVGQATFDQYKDWRISRVSKAMRAGDGFMDVTLEGVCLKINKNV